MLSNRFQGRWVFLPVPTALNSGGIAVKEGSPTDNCFFVCYHPVEPVNAIPLAFRARWCAALFLECIFRASTGGGKRHLGLVASAATWNRRPSLSGQKPPGRRCKSTDLTSPWRRYPDVPQTTEAPRECWSGKFLYWGGFTFHSLT